MHKPSAATIWNLLKEPELNAAALLSELSKDSEIADLYAADAGVWEGFTIQEHTLMVLENFRAQYPLFQKKFAFRAGENIRLQELLRISIALHDIGKPLAIRNGDKKMQHEFTLEILASQLRKWNFNDAEIRLSLALVGHDFLGEMVKGRTTPEQTLQGLQQTAMHAALPMQDFFPIQCMFYCIDAAAYPSLRQRIFTINADGLLIPDRDSFYTLCSIAGQPIT